MLEIQRKKEEHSRALISHSDAHVQPHVSSSLEMVFGQQVWLFVSMKFVCLMAEN